jgi:hypothetical protein
MRNTHLCACVAATMLVAHTARADVSESAPLAAFGLFQPHATWQADVETPRFTYMPVIGSWIDIGRPGTPHGDLVLDGLCQDLVAFIFVSNVVTHGGPEAPIWRVLPWFPPSGGGGLSIKATF